MIVAGEFDEQRQNRQEGVEMNEEWDKKAMDLRTEMEAHKSLSKPASGDWIEVMDTATGASCWYPVELYDQLRITELRRRGIDP